MKNRYYMAQRFPFWVSTPQNVETLVHEEVCPPVFTAALCTVARTGQQRKCPSAGDPIKEKWDAYAVEYYSATKKMKHCHLWQHGWVLRASCLREASQTEKDKNRMISVLFGVCSQKQQMHEWNTHTHRYGGMLDTIVLQVGGEQRGERGSEPRQREGARLQAGSTQRQADAVFQSCTPDTLSVVNQCYPNTLIKPEIDTGNKTVKMFETVIPVLLC